MENTNIKKIINEAVNNIMQKNFFGDDTTDEFYKEIKKEKKKTIPKQKKSKKDLVNQYHTIAFSNEDLFGNKYSDEERKDALDKLKKLRESNKSYLKKKYINLIYKVLNKEKATSRIYSDDAWQGKNYVCDLISNIPGVTDFSVWCENGGYKTSRDGLSHWKEYLLSVEFNNEITINGTLNCHAAGTMEDPFSKYDITVVLY